MPLSCAGALAMRTYEVGAARAVRIAVSKFSSGSYGEIAAQEKLRP
jgi:hypothetical protein